MATFNSVHSATPLPQAERLAETFVDLARSVTEGADMVDVFTMLSERTVELLPVQACGLLVIDAAGDLQVIGTSGYSASVLDLYQVQNDEGPCRQCCSTGQPVADTSLDPQGPWPQFARLAREHGFNAVYALPLGARGVSVGALNLFTVAPLGQSQLVVAQALADAATMALLQSDPQHDLAVVSRQLYDAVESRNSIEQAKGVIAQRYGVDPVTALAMLRAASGELGQRLADLATAVVQRTEATSAAGLFRDWLANHQGSEPRH